MKTKTYYIDSAEDSRYEDGCVYLAFDCETNEVVFGSAYEAQVRTTMNSRGWKEVENMG